MNPFIRYAKWLHLDWPSGTVEKLPRLNEDGSTAVPGVYVAGDLRGIPLLKFALDSGARVVATIAADASLRADASADALDLVILGAGVSGLAAAVEARERGLSFRVIESSEPLTTLVNFPRAKPIFTYPSDWKPAGRLQVGATIKEALIEELRSQLAGLDVPILSAHAERVEREGSLLATRLTGGETIRSRRVLIAVGRSGDFRRLGIPGETLGKVFNRLHDPGDFSGLRCLVVGGGDAAAETAIALAESGAEATLSYRGAALVRPKPELRRRLLELAKAGGRLRLALGTTVREIRPREVVLAGGAAPGERGPSPAGGGPEVLPNDVVFSMIGREAPLDFLRRCGIPIDGDWTAARWTGMGLFMLFCACLYSWESGGFLSSLWSARHWFPNNLPEILSRAGGATAAAAADPGTLLGTLAISAAAPSFWYTLAFSTVMVVFGIRRIRRRRTPYVTAQTLTLMAVQVFPLFVLPEIVLPLLGHRGLLPRGLADALFPVASYGHGREYWRAYGFILAWPLNVYNLFTPSPLWWWIAIGFVQTCVLIPIAVYFFGKGAYCGWICSCGGLAETLGDTHRRKMPHGPGWNRLNLAGQGVLAIAVLLLLVRIAGWALPPGNWADLVFEPLKESYKWTIDVFLAGVLGYGLYFWLSGRVWCRFFCPLAALMNIYARLGRFAIVADKKKCISCGQCTAVCHQGIDVMSFANRGAAMRDPECVRCGACLHTCPTGVLQFGQVDRGGNIVRLDQLAASPVRMREVR